MKLPFAFAVLPLAFLMGCPSVRADDFQGADAIVKQIEAQSKEAGAPARKTGPLADFKSDLKGFREHVSTLPPAEAARGWLALFDRAGKLPVTPEEQAYGSSLPPHLAEIFEALPPPADWDALSAAIAERPAAPKGKPDLSTPVLRIVAATLRSDHDAAHQAIETLQQQLADAPARGSYRPPVQGLWDAFYQQVGDKASILKNFEVKLARLKAPRSSGDGDSDNEMSNMNALEVPNLLDLTDAAKAEELLRQVFALPVADVEINDKKTAALGRKVALSMGEELKCAPWGLVNTLDATALYELLDRRFPADPAHDRYRRQQANTYYLLGLIAQARYDEAAARAVKMGRTSTGRSDTDLLGDMSEYALADLAMKGHAREVYQFFDHLLKDHPELPYWQSYISSAVLAGETEAMLASVKAASERTDLKPAVHDTLRTAYGEALLAADHVDDALPILREAAAVQPSGEAEQPGMVKEATQQQLRAATRLACLGFLLGDNALLNHELDAIATVAKAQPGAINHVYSLWEGGLDELYLAVKRGPELERLLTGGVLQGMRDAATQRARMRGYGGDFYDEQLSAQTRESLFGLVALYSKVDRQADIVTLLDSLPQWGADDLAKLINPQYYSYQVRHFGYQVALALHKTSHDDAALRVVNNYLESHGGSDPAYALLLELLPAAKAEARLDELFEADQFEERPLIWRAKLQFDQGRVDEAEKSVRQAISIDPSDGEEGRGDRMRAYAVLGDILERKGDTEKAGQMRRAVQAIRLSEDADRLHAAGLLTRAVDLYKKALGYFSDAYCIQSRLAIQLVALGKTDEAMTHYERAYELMPESFGRMESHCFGCERAFAGERAQGIAERVFNQLVAKQPDNPRVHYLLGYLRGEEDRDAEAAQQYREAVRLDPDYINAWKQLASVTDDPADRDHAALNLLRLDPQRKHDHVDLTTVGDLRALWPAVAAAMKFTPPKPSDLYPLAASKAFLEQEKQRAGKDADAAGSHIRNFYHRSEDEPFTPGAVMARNKVIAEALMFLPRNDASE